MILQSSRGQYSHAECILGYPWYVVVPFPQPNAIGDFPDCLPRRQHSGSLPRKKNRETLFGKS